MPGRRAAVRPLLVVVVVATSALALPATARADEACTVTWNGGDGSWTDASRWSPARVPTAEDTACAGGFGSSTIQVDTAVAVHGVQLTFGAGLAVGRGGAVRADTVFLYAVAVTGRGTVTGGQVSVTASTVTTATVTASSDLELSGLVQLAQGARLVSSGRTGLGTEVDVEGDAGTRFRTAVLRSDSTGVKVVNAPLTVGRSGVVVRDGRVRLGSFTPLADDGTLRSGSLAVSAPGTLVLPRTITGIDAGAVVSAGDLTTDAGGDALAGLTRVDGALTLARPLATAALTVGGRLVGTTFTTPRVTATGFLQAQVVSGAVVCRGECRLRGATVGSLVAAAGSRLETLISRPLVVRGAARVAGADLLVDTSTTPQVPTGQTLVLLTAAGGVTGTFRSVTSEDEPTTVTLAPKYRGTYVTGTLARRTS